METSVALFEKLKIFSEPELREEIESQGKVLQAGPGDVLIKEGQYLDFLPIVIKGLIRVYQTVEDREILLYYVGPEQTCMMSLSSAYFDYISAANGMAMEHTEILVLPAYFIADWQLKYPSWNRFIINTFKSRYDDLLGSFRDVAFKPVQERVMDYLTERTKDTSYKKINISHQELANELGTTRVVISRILKQFEKEGKMKLYRGFIHLKQVD